ncbi:hypothetical protein AGMMS50239_37340 [Bacteroidia bacterium]|nr:hypothetical protein AGMMS50239_37340 [Bacteroidia bacterium]
MQKINHHIEEDNFRKIIKEKLEGYSLPVREEIWNKIEKGIDKKPRKIVLWPWISGTAAAAAVALLALLLFPINDKKINSYETTSPLSDYSETIDESVPVETVHRPVSPSPVKPERVFVTRKTKGEYAESGYYPEIDIIKGEIVSEEEPEITPPVSESEMKNAQVPNLNRQEKVVFPNRDPFGDDSPTVKKSPKRKSIGLSLGSGGNLSAMNTNSGNNLMQEGVIGQLRSNFYDASSESKTEERLLIEDFPDVTHRVPLSFGLTVKKELNRTFSLETGLVYTFLDSRFKNRSWEKEALLQLHYIGIPVNIQARILGNKKSDWEVYLSAGGMVEKGIYSHYKQTNQAKDSEVLTIVSNEKINGLQYSVSFAPGIDYKIYRNYSVYLEPKISYCFDNKQPVSARTEHPVVIGVNAGLRFCW